MRPTGIVRRVDELGRFVIPREVRVRTDIRQGDPVEIAVDGEQVVVQKYIPSCIFCGGNKGVLMLLGRQVCSSCETGLINLARGGADQQAQPEATATVHS